MSIKLNLGCGTQPKAGWVNQDRWKGPGIESVFDLDEGPWPLYDGQAEQIEAFDVFEHVEDPLLFMAECWRILKPDGELYIHTSYFRNPMSYGDPTHRRFCTERTFEYWVPGTYMNQRYGPAYTGGKHFRQIRLWLDSPVGDLNIRLAKLQEGWPS